MTNVTKPQLIAMLAEKVGGSKKDVETMVDALIDVITTQLQKGNKVTLTGFGAFKVSTRAARTGVNPKTGASISIPAMTVPKFTSGKALKDAVK